MRNAFLKFINRSEIDLGNKEKNIEFFKVGRELISILFAVVFALGLKRLGDFELSNFLGKLDFWILVLSYIAIVLSWFGYHFGIISGPIETNKLNYVIDILLLVVYWLLINKGKEKFFVGVLCLFSIMFFLYWMWEFVRAYKYNIEQSQKDRIIKAIKVNRLYFITVSGLSIIYSISLRLYGLSYTDLTRLLYVLILFFMVIVYRLRIGKAYKGV